MMNNTIFLARTGSSKEEIKKYIVDNFGYDLSRTLDEIRPGYRHIEICQETVPEAITGFLESTDFEDALRCTISLGGDADTTAAITGSIAEAFYGVPDDILDEARKYIPAEINCIVTEYVQSVIRHK